jgi:enterochelin esterase-like enzyme
MQPPVKPGTLPTNDKTKTDDLTDGTDQSGKDDESNDGDEVVTPGKDETTDPVTDKDKDKDKEQVPPVVKPDPTPKEPEIKDPGTMGDGDFTIGASAYSVPDDSKCTAYSDETKLKEFEMFSKDSKIYKGQDEYLKEKGDFSRKGWLYLPKGYSGDKELPFIFVGDGSWSQHKDLMRCVLDNLIRDRKIPPMAAIFMNPGPLGGGDGPGSQRSFEYDSVTTKFSDWVETEVLPKMTKDFGVKFTTNPEGRATMGGSSSGAMAFTMAWFHPDRYRRVITYSGTYVRRIKTPENPDGAYEYHSKLIPNSDKKPLRVYIEVGENDNNFKPDTFNNWITANQAMAKAFKDKGYHYKFDFAKGAGHIDGKVYKQTLPGVLEWLWRGYPIP